MRWLIRVGIVALALTSIVPLIAGARHASVADPNDSRGVLDIRLAEVAGGSPTRWKVTSWSKWKVEPLWDRGFTLVYVDTFGTTRADYYALVGSNGRKLQAGLYRDPSRRRDRRIRDLRARHPSQKVVNVAIPLQRLRRRDSGVYRWYVLTLLSGDNCRRVCFDRAPDTGAVLEPGPQPTPTLPTPTPTPTVTP